MSISPTLQTRSNGQCELCKSENGIAEYEVAPQNDAIVACETCVSQITSEQDMDANHWRCLNDSMWSEVPAVQVIAWRMLTRLRGEGWPQDLLDMLYLDDETLAWAKATGEGEEQGEQLIHKDSNGAILEGGDTVVLTKDLNVKGANFTAKRGTAVRNISLVHDNARQIEGKVNGQQIVILTQFVKKS